MTLNQHAQRSHYLYHGPIDQVYVSWTESCEIHAYIDLYLQKRGFVVNDATRSAIALVLERYRGPAPYLLVDLDHFLAAAAA
jgi:hypothetical protein